VQSPLIAYDLQISALLFIVLYFTKKYYLPSHPTSHLLESVIFTFVIVSVVLSNGGIDSPFFFLIYFLLFAVALMLEPVVAMASTLSLIIFFIFSLPQDQPFKVLIPIFSLAFISPFAMFMGKEYEKNQKLKIKDERLKMDSSLFISLIIKTYVQNLKKNIENFTGDRELHEIRHQVNRLEKQIEEYERSI
jgi:hypothetical protein